MNDELFEQILRNCEAANDGWLHGGKVPQCDVYIDGVLKNNLIRVNRAKGIAVVAKIPIEIVNEKIVTYEVTGVIEVKQRFGTGECQNAN